jgi:E3 ubiquitin-protein ligase RFWD2
MSRHEVVAARISSSLLLWDLTSDRCVRTMKGHVNIRNFVGMDTNGPYVACGSEDSQVRLQQPLLLAFSSPSHANTASSLHAMH